MSNYTPRVLARGELAKALKSQPERAIAAGIKESELDVVAVEGDNAYEADREQNVQLAQNEVALKDRARMDESILSRGDDLRDRLPAVIKALLDAGNTTDAGFLSALSFSRFRLRNLPPPDPSLAQDPRVKLVERVEREDKLTRIDGLAKFTATVLTREPIVTELASRGIDRDALTQLHADADASVRAGRNVRTAAEATARESAAVQKQKATWNAIQRMVRKAVRGDATLEKLYAQC